MMETEENLSTIIITLFIMLFSWIFIHRLKQRNSKGPKTWPFLGAAIEQLVNYDRMHDWMVEYLSQSRTVVVPMPFTTYTYVADPANVEHVLRTNFSNYPKGEVYHSYMEVLLGDGIFNADGELWRKQRKTASFEFASKNLRDFSTVVFREYSLKLFDILCQASYSNQEIDMQELLMRMTLDSICKVGFGVEIGTLVPDLPDNQFAKAFDMANTIVTLRFIDPLWKVKKFFNVGSEAVLDQSIKTIDDFTYSVIKRRKAEIEESEGINKDEKRSQSNMTDKSLRDVVLNFVIAGRDTTATTLAWAIYMIMTHKNVADKLYSELKRFEEDRAEEEEGDPSSIRFAGPKGILQDDVLPDGTKVKAGGMVTYVPYAMGRMEYNWGPDAASFDPERWLKDGVFQNSSPFKFTAFQAGPRICLGKDSAYLQMKMALAILCRFYEFKLLPGHLVAYRMMTILSMAHGLKLTVSRRQQDS
ncbi:UNVERIFIED_CONTAM: cytochrome [Sesamum calycinum]|uniref:Cytochrome n=1 Tax=Sesamum calycinum TaxID=2727403 RepID=A0AAW2QXH1_9LAMI